MDIEKIIKEIVNGESKLHSTELLNWIGENEENRKNYIRYKNTWALLQRGKELEESQVKKDFEKVTARIKSGNKTNSIFNILRYAAIIVFALVGGYLLNSIQSENTEIAWNEITVPNGNRTSIMLPDSTEVWLTNGSKLEYPERFSENERNVKLTGEAYFKVSHNQKKPFAVQLGEHKINVLGTEFSAISYPDDNLVQVDLVTGKVKLDIKNNQDKYSSINLVPLQRVVYNKSTGDLKKSKIKDQFFRYWQEGVYEFKNEPFLELSKKIERIYGVKVVFADNEMKSRSFTGEFNIDDNIYTMMEVFKRASGSPFEYEIKRNTISIKSIKK